jgi:hypothetical protein
MNERINECVIERKFGVSSGKAEEHSSFKHMGTCISTYSSV